jgi:hypothetical protein
VQNSTFIIILKPLINEPTYRTAYWRYDTACHFCLFGTCNEWRRTGNSQLGDAAASSINFLVGVTDEETKEQ